jgi:hypothetical protein
VLSTLAPKSEPNADILIAAQDMFFGASTRSNVEDRVRDFAQAVSHVDGMIIDRDLTEVTVANHLLYRVDYSGVGLFRARLETEGDGPAAPCHSSSHSHSRHGTSGAGRPSRG